MELVIVNVLFLSGVFLGALAHEWDLYRACRKYGDSGYAGWFFEFHASEMKEDDA